MTVLEKAPTILTTVGARRLTARIRDAVALSDDLLAQAFEGRAWEALGHESFRAYCEAELPELRMMKLRAAPRRELVAKLRARGANIPDLVAATGASLGTVHADLVALEGGHRRAPAPEPEPESALTAYERAAAHVARQAEKGLTCWEYEEETGLRHGAASAAFSTAKRRGLIVPDGRIRNGYGVHVTVQNAALG